MNNSILVILGFIVLLAIIASSMFFFWDIFQTIPYTEVSDAEQVN